jgi:flagellar L-ring protein precursor FlgH
MFPMKKARQLMFKLAAISTSLGIALPVGAQISPTNSAPQAYTTTPAAAGESGETPQKVQVPIGAMVQRNGGSLARAQIFNQNDSGSVPAASISYFAVPEQKPKLLHKHDLVTIIVREDSNFSSDGTTDLKHSSDLDAVVDSYVTLGTATGLSLNSHTPAVPIEVKSTGQRDFKGQGTVNRTDSFTANITAEIVDVKPNGTLILQAHKTIKTDEEEQEFELVGTCRVQDITADNSVLSTQLYNTRLIKNHKGAVKDTTSRGLIPRLLDWINPF